ncbi:MAG: UDP-N-acetylmuramate dehydrogenase [Planctomycetia bacterium]|nr:UDP-N-acetylmuramate dehydrogenase [Planctomycetia bacterium]
MTLFNDFGDIVQKNAPLGVYTWFQLGGSADFLAEPRSWDSLAALVKRAAEAAIPWRLMGGGSNILVRDEGVRGLVIRAFENLPYEIAIEGNLVRVSGNVPLSRLITTAVSAGLGGLEGLVGIPGSVGAALHGNVSANSTDIGRFLKSAAILSLNGEVTTREGADLFFGYRESPLDDCVIIRAEFELHPEAREELSQQMLKQWIIAKAAQPMGHQCSGRIFKNSNLAADNASEIIESVGLKGKRIGGAVVSLRHANFIVADPECSVEDVLQLIEFVRDAVFEKTGLELELELEVW